MSLYKAISFCFILLLGFSSQGNTTPKQLFPPVNPNLRVLTWNIQMLPRMWIKKRQIERVDWIVEELKRTEVDIVVLQELFDGKATRMVKKGLLNEFPYQIGPHNKKVTIKQSTGVMIISRIPIEYKKHVFFSKKKGSDALANKGCLLIQGEKNAKSFQIAGTHLQAGNKEKHQQIRNFQLDQIFSQIITPFQRKGTAQLVIGDLNTPKRDTESFDSMLKRLDMQEVSISEERQFTYDNKNSWNTKYSTSYQLDYILINNRESNTRIKKQTIFRPQHQDKNGLTVDLADHYGIWAEIELR